MESKIDFDGKKYAIVKDETRNVIARLNDMPVVSNGFFQLCVAYSLTYYTLYTNPDYKADKYDVEFLAKTNESKEMIYTQEMFDNGEVPHVGMMFICKEKTADSRISDFMGKAVKVIGVSNLNGDEVITFSHETRGIGCGVFGGEWVKPIDTRTDEEKAIDDLVVQISATQFDANMGDMDLRSIVSIAFNSGILFTGDKK